MFLVARSRAARWPTEILREGAARITLPDGSHEGKPELVTDSAERANILALFRERYGLEQFERWYDRPARILRIRLDHPSLSAGQSESDRYYGWLEAEFDNVAADYDRHILGNRINRLLRDRSLAILRERFRASRSLLEVGCGSGMETLPLLREGHEILAVDISDRMLGVVRDKARAEGVSERLRTRKLRAAELSQLARDWGEGAFDAAYSTYGALNCEPNLVPVRDALRTLLGPGSPFVAGVYNRWCLFEILGYSLTLQPHRASGRRRNPVAVGSSRFCVDVYAHSASDFLRLFSLGFDIERLEGVPVILPPSDLTMYADRFSRRFETLSTWDRRFGARWPWNRLGDHFLAVMVRCWESGAPSPPESPRDRSRP